MKINDEGTSNAAHWYERAMKAESRLAEAERDTTWQDHADYWQKRCLKAEALLREARDYITDAPLADVCVDRINAFLTTNSPEASSGLTHADLAETNVMVKRYDPDVTGEGRDFGDACPCMTESACGDYVLAHDYDTLAAERDALLVRNEELRSANGYAELEARLAEAEALRESRGWQWPTPQSILATFMEYAAIDAFPTPRGSAEGGATT